MFQSRRQIQIAFTIIVLLLILIGLPLSAFYDVTNVPKNDVEPVVNADMVEDVKSAEFEPAVLTDTETIFNNSKNNEMYLPIIFISADGDSSPNPSPTSTLMPTSTASATLTATSVFSNASPKTPTAQSTSVWRVTPTATPSPTSKPEDNPSPTTTPDPIEEFVITSEGGTLVSSDGLLQLKFPAGTVNEETIIQYRRFLSHTQFGFAFINQQFELTAWNAQGEQVTEFNKNLTAIISYTEPVTVPENDLQLYYSQEGIYWKPISTTVDSANNQIIATFDHFTEFSVGIGNDVPAYVTDAFIAAYNINSEYIDSDPTSDVHRWNGDSGPWVQDFRDEGGAIIYNQEQGRAYYIEDPYMNRYHNVGGPNGYLGLPTSDRYDPPEDSLLLDKKPADYRQNKIHTFEGGFIGKNSVNGQHEASRYFPVIEKANVKVEHIQIPDPDDPDRTVTKANVTLTIGEIQPNPPQNDSSISWIWLESDNEDFRGWVSQGDNTWEGYDLSEEFSFRIEAGTPTDRRGYLLCASYKNEFEGEDYLIRLPLSVAGTFRYGYDCEGFGGGGYIIDNTPPVIHHEPNSEDSAFGVWQNGKGWAIIAAEITDNVGVAWGKVTLNGEEYPMTFYGGNTYVAIVRLKLGKNTYFISAEDTFGNEAFHPEGDGMHEIYSDMAFSYGYRPWMSYSEDPINTGIGNFVYSYKDAELKSLGPDVVIERWFNHQSTYKSPFGLGWSFLYDMRLMVVENALFSGAQLRYADGRKVNFESDGAGGFTAPETVQDTLEKQGDKYILTTKKQLEYHFDSTGRLINIVDKNGHAVTLSYDSNERLNQIMDASNRVITVSYATTDSLISSITIPEYGELQYEYENDRLVAMTDTVGSQVSYEYDEETWCITAITSPEGKPFLADQTCDEDRRVDYQLGGTGYINEFIYDDEAQTTTIVDPYSNTVTHIYDEDWRVIQEVDAFSNSVSYTYNDDYQPLTVTDKSGTTTIYTYDENGNPLTVTDGLSNTTTYTYDEDNNLLSRTDAQSNTWYYEYDEDGHLIAETDPLSGTMRYEYNNAGLIIKETNQLSHTTYTAYNELGLPMVITDALGNVTRKTYDEAGNLLTETNALGHTTSYEYNNIGLLLSVTDPLSYTISYVYDSDQNVILETNQDGFTKTYTYDDNNRLVAESDWQGNITRYVYDDLARKIAEIDALSQTVTFDYDAVGNLVTKTNKLGAETTYTYDAKGNLLTETDALGNVTKYVYDKLGRQIEVHRPCDCASRIEYTIYDELGRVTERIDVRGNSTYFEYDALGREIRRTDALSNTTERIYDAAGQVIAEINALSNTLYYDYDALGRVTTITNRLGYTTSTIYDAIGQVIATTDENGYTSRTEYDANGRVSRSIDALNNATTYTYDGRGNKLTVTDALSRVTESIYDANGNILTTINPRGHATYFGYDILSRQTVITDALDGVTSVTYNPAGAKLSVTDARGYTQYTGYDILGRVITETDRNGNTSTFGYDVAGNVVTVTNALDGVTTYTYDANGNQLSETDALNHTTQYVYDELNRLVETIDALNGITRSRYDAVGQIIMIEDANGHKTFFDYDAEGQQVAVTDALNHTSYNTYDPAGNLLVRTDRNENSTYYGYDALNRTAIVTNALSNTATTTYDAVGNVIARTNFRGYTTHFAYDKNNNLITITDALSGTTYYGYDALDRKISETDANDHTTTFTYDAIGNLLEVTLPEGQSTTYTYDGEGNRLSVTNGREFTTYYTYDALNRQVSETDPLSHTKTTTYDAVGQVLAQIDANENPIRYTYDALGRLITVTDALSYSTTYSYDAVGNRLSKTDANDNTILFSYDALNRLITEVNPISSTWYYTYDPESNLIQQIDANGQTIRYGFDTLNQLVANYYPDPTLNETYRYDENGNLVQMTDPEGTTTLVYDPLDREVSKTDVYSYVVEKAYDPVGNLTAIIYPDGNRTQYQYNDNNWLTTMIDPKLGETDYTYNANGQVERIDNANDTWTLQVYDRADRLVRIFNGTTFHDGVITSYDYTLDAVGNRLEVIEEYTQGQVRTNVKTYTYNDRYELLEAVEVYEGPPAYTVTTSYTYDPAGNRLSMASNRDIGPGPQPEMEVITYSYNAANQMLTAGDISFSYDANGNRLSKLTPATPPAQERLETYEYDFQNRLTQYTRIRVKTDQIEQRVYNKYDALGRRVNKGLQDATGVIKWTHYVVDGLSYDQLAEYPQVGPPRVTELYRGQRNQLVSMDEIQGDGAGSQYWFAHDGLESVAATTKQDGQSAHEYFYDPYGQLIDENGHWEDSSSWTNPHNHYLLSGKEWDEESRLYYFGARFYDAQVGVWLTPDPLRGETRIPWTLHPYFGLGQSAPNSANTVNSPMSLHRYLYVQNNPTSLIDLDGYSACGPYAKCTKPMFNNPASSFLMSLIQFVTGRDWKQDLINLATNPDSIGVELNLESLYQIWSGGLDGKTLFDRDLTPETLKALKTPVAPIEPLFGSTNDWTITVNFDQKTNNTETKLGVCLQGKVGYELGVTFRFPNPIIKGDLSGEVGFEGKGCTGVVFTKPQNHIQPFLEFEGSAYGAINGRLYAELNAGIAGARAGIGGAVKLSYKMSCSSYNGCNGGEPNLGLEIYPFYGYKYWGGDWEDKEIFKYTQSLALTQ